MSAPPSRWRLVRGQQLTYEFTATATSHDLVIGYEAADDVGSLLIWDDATLTQDAWEETTVAASTVTDSVLRSQSGRIMQNTLTDTLSTAPETSTYSFDAAGRLVTAVIPHHTLTYGYGTASCGVAAAGKNGNRTSFSDNFDGTTTSVAYCYDNADRLAATAVTNAPVGASPVAGGNLTTTGPGASLAYDSHGNTTVLADQTLSYDVADRHIGTVLDDGTTITYTLDAGGRMVARTVTGSPTASENGTIRYLAGGAIADSSSVVQQWVVALPGGVTLSVDVGVGSQVWGFPNLHGDVIVSTDASGTRQGVRSVYDPFGQPIDPTTWAIGTTVADDAVPDLVDGDADFGWVGQHRKYTEHHGSIATIEMGARQYVPALGRFLEVDPVEGGVTNAYDYPGDPINDYDLSGLCGPLCIIIAGILIVVILSIPSDVKQPFNKQTKVAPLFPEPTAASSGGSTADGGSPCDKGGCVSNTGKASACFEVFCVGFQVSFREDRHILVTPSFGVALEAGATANFGQTIGETGGFGGSAGCTASAILGGWFEVGTSPPLLNSDGSWVEPVFSNGGGWSSGLGIGCSAGLGFTFDLGGF